MTRGGKAPKRGLRQASAKTFRGREFAGPTRWASGDRQRCSAVVYVAPRRFIGFVPEGRGKRQAGHPAMRSGSGIVRCNGPLTLCLNSAKSGYALIQGGRQGGVLARERFKENIPGTVEGFGSEKESDRPGHSGTILSRVY